MDRATLVVDDVLDGSLAGQENAEGVVKFNSRVCWDTDATIDGDPMVSEESIDSNTPGLMILNIISNLVSCETIVSILVVNIVWKFRLVKVNSTILAIPFKEVSERMLRCKTVANDIVSVDLKSGFSRVSSVYNSTADIVISSPKPNTINDHVSAINLQHLLCLDWRS